jgi:hypothetical protein
MVYFKNFSKIKVYKILKARLFACLMALTYPPKGQMQKKVKLACFHLKTINFRQNQNNL